MVFMQAAEEESDPHAALRHAAVANKRGISPTGLASRRSVCSGRWGRGEGPVRAHRQMGSVAEAKLVLLWAMGDCSASLAGQRQQENLLLGREGSHPSSAEHHECPLLEVEGGAGSTKRVGWGRNDSLGRAQPRSQMQG